MRTGENLTLRHWDRLRNTRGLSMVETLVSAALLVTAVMIALPYYHRSFSIVKSIESKGKCEAIFQTALSRIETAPPAYQNQALTKKGYFLPDANFRALGPTEQALLPTSDPIIQKRFNRLGVSKLYELNGPIKNVPLPLAAPPPGITVNLEHNGITSYAPLLLSGPMGYLGDLYGENYCPNYLTAPPEIFRGAGSANPEDPLVRLYLQVQRQDVLTRDVSTNCDLKYWPRPRNQFSTSVIKEPHFEYQIANYPDWMRDNYGFQVSLRAEILKPNGQVAETCDIQKSFSLPQDSQNVMDYTKDIKVATAKAPDFWNAPKDDLRNLSNKYDSNFFSTVDPKLQTIYSNFYTKNGIIHTDRPTCAQSDDAATAFTIRLEVRNIDKEPGLIPMCLDTSKNWLRTADDQSFTWCQKESSDISAPGAPQAATYINLDKPFRSQGWVPCENLNLCGERPDQVRVVSVDDSNGKGIRYEYDYRVRNDDNKARKSRLWGCELKYFVALLDSAGNLSYVKDPQLTNLLSAKSEFQNPNVQIFQPQMREVNPRIYLRPPPCYACSCKPCKGKGGFFGGFFNWILVIVVLVSFGLVGLVVCLTGVLFGCLGSGGDYTVPDFKSAGYLACQDMDQGCKCGKTCNAVKAPGPTWRDDVKKGEIVDGKDQSSCAPENRTIQANNGRTFNVKLASKYVDLNTNKYVYLDDPTKDYVSSGEMVTWQQFDTATGMYCYAVHDCSNGQWVAHQETYTDATTGKELPDNMVGCYPVKTAYAINWSNFPDGSKPNIASQQPECLEVEYGKGVFNPTGGKLWSHNEPGLMECGDAQNSGSQPPVYSSDPKRRVIGKPTGNCAGSYPPLNGVVYKPAVNIPINSTICTPPPDTNQTGEHTTFPQNNKWAVMSRLINPTAIAQEGGTSPMCFTCWQGCQWPDFAPSSPMTNEEMKYYEPYKQEDLPLCQSKRMPSTNTPFLLDKAF